MSARWLFAKNGTTPLESEDMVVAEAVKAAGTVDLMKPHLYEKHLGLVICNGVLS